MELWFREVQGDAVARLRRYNKSPWRRRGVNENWQNFTMRGPALGARVERCWRNGMRSVTTIAAKLESTKGAVSYALSRLRQKGAISEAPAAGRPRISTASENQRLGSCSRSTTRSR